MMVIKIFSLPDRSRAMECAVVRWNHYYPRRIHHCDFIHPKTKIISNRIRYLCRDIGLRWCRRRKFSDVRRSIPMMLHWELSNTFAAVLR